MNRINIFGLSLEELKESMSDLGEKPFRAVQIFEWVYKKGITELSMMKNLPAELIKKLGYTFEMSCPEPAQKLRSRDGTEKFIFKLKDGKFVESVIIPSKDRTTLCVSTQVGCKYSCAFCASGFHGFKRDLEPYEIMAQIFYAAKRHGMDITNYVFMGMGEPLDNFDNLAKVILNMNSPKAMGIGAGRITVSTCGLVPGIERLGELGININLSISLHAANDSLRNKLVPINNKYPIKVLVNAAAKFMEHVSAKITFEYILIKGVNDSDKDRNDLVRIAKALKAKVNVIPYSPVKNFNFNPPDKKEAADFSMKILKSGINSTVRESKGKDINAACGQLAGEMNK